jgi:hypothetical protein
MTVIGKITEKESLRALRSGVGPVFQGEAHIKRDSADPREWWTAKLNGKSLGGFGTLERAKAAVDWAIWNRGLNPALVSH